jgi:triosephosphate isomerase
MSGEKIVLANWKANLSPPHAAKWLASFREQYRPDAGIRVVLAAPFLHLQMFGKEFRSSDRVSWAAQDVSPFPPGSYTGSFPAAWLQGMVDFVLTGHRERRRYFHESIQDVAGKVRETTAAGLTPIICMDRQMAAGQIAALDMEDMEQMMIACTPDEAESLEVAGSPGAIAEDAAYFREISGGCPVLYGGGVNKDNVAGFLSQPLLSGVMVASGCLYPQDFAQLLRNAAGAVAGAGT